MLPNQPDESAAPLGNEPNTNPTKPNKFTDKQLRWAEEYAIDFNAARAARDAGYSVESARDMGHQNKQNPALMALVDERHRALTMSADEATRHLSDMAATRLNDFMVTRPVQGYEMQELYVTTLISMARTRIEHLLGFIKRNGLVKQERAAYDGEITHLRKQILDYEIEVERFGDDISRLVPGRPVVHYVTELDLVALANAKDVGRIKKFKHTKEGVEVETYAADAAARDILKLNGRYEKHNQQKKADVTITIGGRTISSRPTVTDEN
ncbi:terminase small subunit [uncultured Hymenobacter sp.]|uniref:terminase small subunit n=1 Tax=uncultured Hymenobacter sp. TaxID=170016 RepID=UPI0035C99364